MSESKKMKNKLFKNYLIGILIIFIVYSLLCLLGIGYGYLNTFINYVAWLIFVEMLFLLTCVIHISTLPIPGSGQLESLNLGSRKKDQWWFLIPFGLIISISYFQDSLINLSVIFVYYFYFWVCLFIFAIFLFRRSGLKKFLKTLLFMLLIGVSLLFLLGDMFGGYTLSDCKGKQVIVRRLLDRMIEPCSSPRFAN